MPFEGLCQDSPANVWASTGDEAISGQRHAHSNLRELLHGSKDRAGPQHQLGSTWRIRPRDRRYRRAYALECEFLVGTTRNCLMHHWLRLIMKTS